MRSNILDMKRNEASYIVQNTIFALIGAILLIFKSQYTGTYSEVVLSYGGNICGSFAVYFILRLSNRRLRINRFFNAVMALLIVQVFEITDGFGVMSNVYDPFDLIANTIGIAAAILVDIVASNISHNQTIKSEQ